MLNAISFTRKHIDECVARLGCRNPVLLEKAIIVLQLVGHLAEAGLPFQFRGGSSLLLLVQPVRRLSIDADIATQATAEELDAVLERVAELPPFTGVEHDVARDRALPPKKHYRVHYPSALPAPSSFSSHILLDVLFEAPGQTEFRLISTPFIQPERDVRVAVPGINELMGDKLSAFAPQTIGILYHDERTADIVKQLFDIAVLFDVATDLAAVAAAYEVVQANQCRYRQSQFTLDQTLDDTIQACLELSQHDLKGAPKDAARGRFFFDGIAKLEGHLLTPFLRDQARIAAGKVACVAAWVKRRPKGVPIESLRSSAEKLQNLGDKTIAPPWAPLGKLKGGNPEAFLYWWQAQRLFNGAVPW